MSTVGILRTYGLARILKEYQGSSVDTLLRALSLYEDVSVTDMRITNDFEYKIKLSVRVTDSTKPVNVIIDTTKSRVLKELIEINSNLASMNEHIVGTSKVLNTLDKSMAKQNRETVKIRKMIKELLEKENGK